MKLKTSIVVPVLLTAVMLSTNSNGQQKNIPARAAGGAATKPAGLYNAYDSLHFIEEHLVDLAMKGPRYEASEHQNKVNEYQLKKAQSTWLNLLAVSYNVNDQTFKKPSTPATVTNVYPKYTFGVTVPLGIIFSHTETKAAREQIKIGKNSQDVLARAIRKEVITKYLQYKSLTQTIINLTITIDDESASVEQVKENFKKNQTTIEQFNAVSKAYNTDLAQRAQLQLQQDMYKLELEEMIGIPLEEALAYKPEDAKP